MINNNNFNNNQNYNFNNNIIKQNNNKEIYQKDLNNQNYNNQVYTRNMQHTFFGKLQIQWKRDGTNKALITGLKINGVEQNANLYTLNQGISICLPVQDNKFIDVQFKNNILKICDTSDCTYPLAEFNPLAQEVTYHVTQPTNAAAVEQGQVGVYDEDAQLLMDVLKNGEKLEDNGFVINPEDGGGQSISKNGKVLFKGKFDQKNHQLVRKI